VARVQVTAVDGDQRVRRPDTLVTEEPLEIRVQGAGEEAQPFAVTMRTPGNDFELAAGLLVTEGVLDSPDDLAGIEYCTQGERPQAFNVVTVRCRRPVADRWRPRPLAANASCGVCGKATLDDLEVRCPPVAGGPEVGSAVVATLPERVRELQRVFGRTGGLHAAAAVTPDGVVEVVREDVGRHNALDKLVGLAFLERRLPLRDALLFVSGRASFEIVQKAAVAGLAVVCAVSAPSSLAVETAERFGQTLVGFLRDGRFNVYTHPERIAIAA
jgi:FdhD protein